MTFGTERKTKGRNTSDVVDRESETNTVEDIENEDVFDMLEDASQGYSPETDINVENQDEIDISLDIPEHRYQWRWRLARVQTRMGRQIANWPRDQVEEGHQGIGHGRVCPVP